MMNASSIPIPIPAPIKYKEYPVRTNISPDCIPLHSEASIDLTSGNNNLGYSPLIASNCHELIKTIIRRVFRTFFVFSRLFIFKSFLQRKAAQEAIAQLITCEVKGNVMGAIAVLRVWQVVPVLHPPLK